MLTVLILPCKFFTGAIFLLELKITFFKKNLNRKLLHIKKKIHIFSHQAVAFQYFFHSTNIEFQIPISEEDKIL